jgi:hypothetical protein
MVVSNSNAPKARLTVGQKLIIAGLFCLEIPSAAIFYPAATLIILTGFGAPLSPILLRIGTLPFTVAMKRKAAWQSGGDPNVESGQWSEP